MCWPNSPEILLTCGKASGKKPGTCLRVTERILSMEDTVQTLDSRANFRSLPWIGAGKALFFRDPVGECRPKTVTLQE